MHNAHLSTGDFQCCWSKSSCSQILFIFSFHLTSNILFLYSEHHEPILGSFREGGEEIASQSPRATVFGKVLAKRYTKSDRPSSPNKSSDSGYSSAPSSKRSSFPISDHDILEGYRPEEDHLEGNYFGKKKLTGFLALDANTIAQECSYNWKSTPIDRWGPNMYPEVENFAEFLDSKVEHVSILPPSEEDTRHMGLGHNHATQQQHNNLSLSHNKASHSAEDVSEGLNRSANPFDDHFARENSPCEAGQMTSVRLSPEPPQSESTFYTSTPPSETDESPSTDSDDDMTDNEDGGASEPETSFSFRSSSNTIWPLIKSLESPKLSHRWMKHGDRS